ncbi:helix-turn-helix transcriptional regulator [Flavobacterium sp. NRK1]|uniref:AraC family transcriptional regulator n=1 Tax=Flavobacterium sp. NRK1 TaxID=2954929 RepID=UPI0020933FE8|nr:helix-turn-helix domain-containing protein [Flavobacterium sp. NRK1]MCO6148579.1 helix-turn-helix domain-containing protein [Flavobacterium sp. NRK1]
MNQREIPKTDAVSLPHPNKLLIIEPLDYPNPYDFHTPHRHDYFEIILVKSGNGFQLIDFTPYDIHAGQLFTVYPGQVHLLQRNSAEGMIIQFRKDIFEFIHPLKHSHLYFSQPAFNLDNYTFSHLYSLTKNIWQLLQKEELSPFSIHKAYSYLQIILITLTELHNDTVSLQEHQIVTQFLSFLPQNIKSKKKVSEYCDLMGTNADKLNFACKNSLGKTALKLIHEELILEIRRLLLLNQLSLKEIAYELNFDSPANFSGFIKANTGLTPTELQASILKKVYN